MFLQITKKRVGRKKYKDGLCFIGQLTLKNIICIKSHFKTRIVLSIFVHLKKEPAEALTVEVWITEDHCCYTPPLLGKIITKTPSTPVLSQSNAHVTASHAKFVSK